MVTKANGRGRGWNKGGKRVGGSGRAAGTVNVDTQELRNAVCMAMGRTPRERELFFASMRIDQPHLFVQFCLKLFPAAVDISGQLKVSAELQALAAQTKLIEQTAAALDEEERLLDLEAQDLDHVDG